MNLRTMAAGCAIFAAGTVLAQAPTIPLDAQDSANDVLQIGNPGFAYWVNDNPWGANGMTEGTAPDQYEQKIGVHPPVGPNGEVAFRSKWRWPTGSNEIKGYPAIINGARPGWNDFESYTVGGHNVRLLDGSYLQTKTYGKTPGSFLPLQLPLAGLTARFARSHSVAPTGAGQLSFDIWLQYKPESAHGFTQAPISHEIMIPLDNWGGYGAYGIRNPDWYDHDVTINGRLYHVYASKGREDKKLLYRSLAEGGFGSLDPNPEGRTGWKFIVFQPDELPVPPGEIDLAAFINYVTTRTDAHGNKWAEGNEYVTAVELGPEIREGTGDVTVYDYKVTAATGSGAQPVRIQAELGTISGTGVSVKNDLAGYEGTGFVGSFVDNGDRLSVSFANVTAGTYNINIRYKTDAPQENYVVVNGTQLPHQWPATNPGWSIKTVPGVSLASGTNVIGIDKYWGWINVDYIEIVPVGIQRVQAENGIVTGSGVGVRTDLAGYEGTGFVGAFTNDGDRLSVSFANVAAGTYDINIRYKTDAPQENHVVINGGAPLGQQWPATNPGWSVKTVPGVSLAAGTNVIEIVKYWGWINVDYVEIRRR